MNIIKILIPIILIIAIKAQTINFSSNLVSGDGFQVNDNIIILTEYDCSWRCRSDFVLTGTNIDKSIIVSKSATLYLDSLTLASTGKLTPLIIDNNCEVKLELEGTSSFVDSSTNENGGIIFLREGAKLKISGKGTLNLMINSLVAINGDNSTSLELNGGNIKIFSTENSAGGLNITEGIIFIGPTFTYEALSGKNPAISAGSLIIINSGNFNIKSGEGKVFQTRDSK